MFYPFLSVYGTCCSLTRNSKSTRSQTVPVSNRQYFSVKLVSVCVLSAVSLSYLGKKRTSVDVCWHDLYMSPTYCHACKCNVFIRVLWWLFLAFFNLFYFYHNNPECLKPHRCCAKDHRIYRNACHILQREVRLWV